MLIARLVGLHAAAAFLFSLSPCDPTDGDDGGGGSGGSGTAALDPSAPIASLTSAEKAELCDWQAGQLGGYGTTTSCPNGTGIALPASQADCVANFASSTNTCQATVQDEYNCVDFLVEDPCLTGLDEAPECEPIVSCD